MTLSILVNGLWQGGLIVAAAYAVSGAARNAGAATRYAVWYVALVALVVVPVLAATSHAGGAILRTLGDHSRGYGYSISLIPVRSYVVQANDWAARLMPWIYAGWILGAAFNLARLGVSFLRITQIRRTAWRLLTPDGDVYLSERVDVPIACGYRSKPAAKRALGGRPSARRRTRARAHPATRSAVESSAAARRSVPLFQSLDSANRREHFIRARGRLRRLGRREHREVG
jgi:hypothetical protein